MENLNLTSIEQQTFEAIKQAGDWEVMLQFGIALGESRAHKWQLERLSK
jgi:hypothetical protein